MRNTLTSRGHILATFSLPCVKYMVCRQELVLCDDYEGQAGKQESQRELCMAAGDADQLPPVSAGSFLSAAIDSGVVPVVDLREVFRQAQGSDIVKAAHAVHAGRMPSLTRIDPAQPSEASLRHPWCSVKLCMTVNDAQQWGNQSIEKHPHLNLGIHAQHFQLLYCSRSRRRGRRCGWCHSLWQTLRMRWCGQCRAG